MYEQSATESQHSPRSSHPQYEQQCNQAIAKLKQVHADINNRFNLLGELRQQFFHNQEKKFVKTFITIMDKLSTQLIEATKATETIDKEISSHPHCLYLQKELDYFRAHRDSTDNQIKQVKEQIIKQYRRHKQIQQQRQILHGQLHKQTTREHKYNNKTKILTMKRQIAQDNNNLFSARPRTASAKQKSSQSKKMGLRNFSFSHKISSGKTTQLTKLQTQKSTRPCISKPFVLQ